MKTRHQKQTAASDDEKQEALELYTRKRIRELLETRPMDVAAAVAVLCRTKRETLHPDRDVFGSSRKESTRSIMASAPLRAAAQTEAPSQITAPGEVLGEEELKAYYNFVSSSGRCRRDCPELYSHMVKRMSILRHEDESDVMHSDMK
jgi:hypothetical protein